MIRNTDSKTGLAALIVAHGSPSAPDGPERVMRNLAASVATLLPGWAVGGATLAAPGAIAAALDDLPDTGRLLVYPHFMSDGWFTTEELPRRLDLAGAMDFNILPAFGLDPAVFDLCLRRAEEAILAEKYTPAVTALLVAAHGSPTDRRPAAATAAAVQFLTRSEKFREVRAGLIDEAPFLADAARIQGPAICLPFFAGRAGHVEVDVPAALLEANFPGPMLAPIGIDAEVPGIVVAALQRAAKHFADQASTNLSRPLAQR
jgi:sirohydrochlorin ferrochelatase